MKKPDPPQGNSVEPNEGRKTISELAAKINIAALGGGGPGGYKAALAAKKAANAANEPQVETAAPVQSVETTTTNTDGTFNHKIVKRPQMSVSRQKSKKKAFVDSDEDVAYQPPAAQP